MEYSCQSVVPLGDRPFMLSKPSTDPAACPSTRSHNWPPPPPASSVFIQPLMRTRLFLYSSAEIDCIIPAKPSGSAPVMFFTYALGMPPQALFSSTPTSNASVLLPFLCQPTGAPLLMPLISTGATAAALAADRAVPVSA